MIENQNNVLGKTVFVINQYQRIYEAYNRGFNINDAMEAVDWIAECTSTIVRLNESEGLTSEFRIKATSLLMDIIGLLKTTAREQQKVLQKELKETKQELDDMRNTNVDMEEPFNEK